MKKSISQTLIKQLKDVVPANQISTEKNELISHSKDNSFHKASLPDVVIWVKNTEEVSKILRLANISGTPVTAYGGGSSLEGNPIPVMGGIVLDMTQMNKILEFMPEDLEVRVQPGIIGEAL